MIAGLPGTGIGGLFYVLSALFMPVRELWRSSVGKGNSANRRLAIRQSAMALLIVAAVWVTGLLLTMMHLGSGVQQASGALRIFYVMPALISFGTLTAVLVVVKVASASVRLGSRMSEQLSDQAPASGGDR